MDDWYKVTALDFEVHKGYELLRLYNYNQTNLIRTVYSEFDWKLWSFNRVPAKSYKNAQLVNKFVTYAEEKLKIKKIEDW